MTDKEWEKLFALIGKLVNLPMPANEKASLLKEEAESAGAMTDLEELASWLQE
jgi:hypothetical protein